MSQSSCACVRHHLDWARCAPRTSRNSVAFGSNRGSSQGLLWAKCGLLLAAVSGQNGSQCCGFGDKSCAPGRGLAPPLLPQTNERPGSSPGLARNSLGKGEILERAKGFEPSTLTLARLCSTPELHPHSKLSTPSDFINQLGSGATRAYMPNRKPDCNP